MYEFGCLFVCFPSSHFSQFLFFFRFDDSVVRAAHTVGHGSVWTVGSAKGTSTGRPVHCVLEIFSTVLAARWSAILLLLFRFLLALTLMCVSPGSLLVPGHVSQVDVAELLDVPAAAAAEASAARRAVTESHRFVVRRLPVPTARAPAPPPAVCHC
jgi:hypothetical protein